MNTLALGTAQRANRLGVQRRRPNSPYADKLRSIFGGNLTAHFPMWEDQGNIAIELAHGWNGTANTLAFGQPGAGDGRTSPLFNGTTGIINAYTPLLSAAWNGQELTISLWVKVFDNAVWTDTATRRFITFQQDGSNRILLQKNPNTGALFQYMGGAVTKSVTRPVAGTTANWTHIALTISKAGDAMKAYWNGVQEGTTQTGLGTWPAGTPTTFFVGAASAAAGDKHYGWMAHLAIGNRALTAAEVAALAVMP